VTVITRVTRGDVEMVAEGQLLESIQRVSWVKKGRKNIYIYYISTYITFLLILKDGNFYNIWFS